MVRPQSRPVTRWTRVKPRSGEFLRFVRRPASTRPQPSTDDYARPRTTF